MPPRAKSTRVPQTLSADELFAHADAAWEAGRHREALKLFRMAAMQGDNGSQHNLGYFAEQGIGMRRNVAEAMKWYRRASRNGSVGSDNNIGILYAERGNVRLAIKWLERSIAKGEVGSAVRLGKIYAERGDSAKARSLWRRVVRSPSEVAECDFEEAQELLARRRQR